MGSSARSVIIKTPTLINNDLTVRDTLITNTLMPRTGTTISTVGNSSVSGTASFGGDISCGNIKAKDGDGVVIKTADSTDAMKIWYNKNVDFYGTAYVA